jgi:hypothetical protein
MAKELRSLCREHIPNKVILSFWQKVNQKGHDECWEWQGSQKGRNYKAGKGYGQLAFRVFGKQFNISAHRLSWLIHHGDIPDGLQVLHQCDNPCCVNPNHLFLGTNTDNQHDMIQKGRAVKPGAHNPTTGERHGMSKLNNDDVTKIRDLWASGKYTQRRLAKMFGVVQSQIHHVVTKKEWKHL